LSINKSGVVIAGFGHDELFPTLLSYEIDGMVFGKLKYRKTNHIDIDRGGPKASVIPFAQKEMVERFLYGLDEKIRADITTFCASTIPASESKYSGNSISLMKLCVTNWRQMRKKPSRSL
jgi:hypothetical protein